MDNNTGIKKESLFGRFLTAVEVAGNKLPDPTVLFMIFTLAVAVISSLAACSVGRLYTPQQRNRHSLQPLDSGRKSVHDQYKLSKLLHFCALCHRHAPVFSGRYR